MSHEPVFALRFVVLTAVMFCVSMFVFLLILPKHSVANALGVGFMIFVGAVIAAYVADKVIERL